jgi:ankyrin repeat protein
MAGMTELDGEGRSSLHYAALDGDVDALRSAVVMGADVDLQDRNGYTPLHLAAQQAQVEAAEALLAMCARVDLQDRYGNQPLWTAVFNFRGDGRVIQMLLAHGADPGHCNRAGKAPAELARSIANSPVAQFFESNDPL